MLESELPSHASVVVIGGGVMGCSTLYHLAKLGVGDAILVERNQLTSGTTWHSSATYGMVCKRSGDGGAFPGFDIGLLLVRCDCRGGGRRVKGLGVGARSANGLAGGMAAQQAREGEDGLVDRQSRRAIRFGRLA